MAYSKRQSQWIFRTVYCRPVELKSNAVFVIPSTFSNNETCECILKECFDTEWGLQCFDRVSVCRDGVFFALHLELVCNEQNVVLRRKLTIRLIV